VALWFDLMVNDVQIGRFVARRLGPVIEDRANHYEVTAYAFNPPVHRRTEVRHFYGDGAWVLLKNAMTALATAPDEVGE